MKIILILFLIIGTVTAEEISMREAQLLKEAGEGYFVDRCELAPEGCEKKYKFYKGRIAEQKDYLKKETAPVLKTIRSKEKRLKILPKRKADYRIALDGLTLIEILELYKADYDVLKEVDHKEFRRVLKLIAPKTTKDFDRAYFQRFIDSGVTPRKIEVMLAEFAATGKKLTWRDDTHRKIYNTGSFSDESNDSHENTDTNATEGAAW